MPQFRLLILLSLILFPIYAETGPDARDSWYAFNLEHAPHPQRLGGQSPPSPTPAGIHGYLTPKGNTWVFADGTPALFYGTNLSFGACFPNLNQAEPLAQHLSHLGYNAVRLHHMDSKDAPDGIFQSNPETDKTSSNLRSLDPQQLKRLDNLIYTFKKYGIYTNINLLVSRNFSDHEGVTQASQLKSAGKPACLFDPTLIALQKKYARALLTHTNSYTGIPYNRDPAIFCVEVVNECSLIQSWQKDLLHPSPDERSLPPYYARTLDDLWQSWLKDKYQNPQNLEQAWNSTTEGHPSTFDHKRPQWKNRDQLASACLEDSLLFYQDLQKKYFDTMVSYLKKELGLKAIVIGMGGTLTAEDEATFDSADALDYHFYVDHPAFPIEAPFHPERFRMHLKSALSPNQGFELKNKLAPLNLSEKPVTITEWSHVYPNEYAWETPLLIAAMARTQGIDALFHYAFTHEPHWTKTPRTINRHWDIATNPQQLLLAYLASRLYLNSETPHVELQGDRYFIKTKLQQSFIGSLQQTPLKLTNLSFFPQKDGVLALMSLDNRELSASGRMLIVHLGRVTSQHASWENPEHFNWGTHPVLLENMPLILRGKGPYPSKLFPLDNQGSRGKPHRPVPGPEHSWQFQLPGNTPWYILEWGGY